MTKLGVYSAVALSCTRRINAWCCVRRLQVARHCCVYIYTFATFRKLTWTWTSVASCSGVCACVCRCLENACSLPSLRASTRQDSASATALGNNNTSSNNNGLLLLLRSLIASQVRQQRWWHNQRLAQRQDANVITLSMPSNRHQFEPMQPLAIQQHDQTGLFDQGLSRGKREVATTTAIGRANSMHVARQCAVSTGGNRDVKNHSNTTTTKLNSLQF